MVGEVGPPPWGRVGCARHDTLCRVLWPSAVLPTRAQNPRSQRGLQPPSSCGLLHIPHILYAQLRRNNQGSKHGHSRAAMPHAGWQHHVWAETASLGQARPDLGPRGLGGTRKASRVDKDVSLCFRRQNSAKEAGRRGWDLEGKGDEEARLEQRRGGWPEGLSQPSLYHDHRLVTGTLPQHHRMCFQTLLNACRGVTLIFTGGHISRAVAFKGPSVILGLYKCYYP